MSVLGSRRILGPINIEMGGDPNPSGSSGGGGGSIEIENNISGYMLKSVGDSSKISGVESLQFDGTDVKAQTDLYVTGSGHNLILQGSDAAGNLNVMYRIEISGGLFRVVPV
jgi:hypothetical protein